METTIMVLCRVSRGFGGLGLKGSGFWVFGSVPGFPTSGVALLKGLYKV